MHQPHKQRSRYAAQLEQMLSALSEPAEQEEPMLADDEAIPTIHVYPVEGGRLLLSLEPLESEEPDQDEAVPHVIDSLPPNRTPTSSMYPPAQPRPPRFVLFLLLLCTFLLLDAADSQLISFLTPTVTITLTPQAHRLTLTSTAQLGRLLAPLTLSQSQTILTTGHGHQDAQAATGTLTLYNGSVNPQAIPGGTVLTGRDGVQVVTAQSVTIPANNPPLDGQATVPTHALRPGATGNIAVGDINMAIASFLIVKNLTPFVGGQDARDFQVVAQADRTALETTLKAKVASSMTAALQGQLTAGEIWQALSCTHTVTANHAVGEEASSLTVSVSETCTTIAYHAEELHQRGMHLLTGQALHVLGAGYQLDGSISVRVLRATVAPSGGVWLAFSCQATWVYQINPRQLIPLLAGQPRERALRLLLHLRGIRTATISGVEGNTPLPVDPQHLTFLEVVEL